MTKSPRKNFQGSRSRLWFTMKRLSLGIALIALTSSILLVSDWNRRKPSVKRIPHVAVMQHASQAILDEGVQGMIADFSGTEKRRLRVNDLLARFEDVRRREQLDPTAAEMLRRTFV